MFRSYSLSPSDYEELKRQAHHMSMFTFFDVRLQIFTNKPENLDYFTRMYTYFRRDTGSTVNQVQQSTREYYVLSNHGPASKTLLFWSQDKCWEILDRDNPLMVVENVIFDSALSQVTTHFLFHGACFCHKSIGLGILGISGAGKTTLSLELARRGSRFLSDEIVALGRNDGRFHPFPRLIACDEATVRLVLPDPEGSSLDTKSVRRDGDTFYINPILLSNQDGQHDCPAKHIFFLEAASPFDDSIQETGAMVEVALLEQRQQFVHDAGSLPGVTLVKERRDLDDIVFFTFVVQSSQKGTFRKLCQSYGPAIAYRVFKSYRPPDANAEPRLIKMSRELGMKKMLSFLRNIVTPFYFDREPDPRDVIEATATIFARSINLNFYRLVPGNLEQTADLVLNALDREKQS